MTPFDERGEVDEAGVAKLLAWFKAAGCDGVVLAGTNGEGPSLSSYEKRDLVQLALDLGTGLQVIMGIASDSLTEAIWLAKQAKKSGAYASLVMPPSYFVEASQEGLAQWYEALCEGSGAPILVYNLPKRTNIRFELETIARLAANPGVVGFKDSSGERGNLESFKRLSNGKRLLVGDETLLLDAIDCGWAGTISGAANVIGEWLVRVARESATDPESSRAKFELVSPALRALRSLPQPFGNKWHLHKLGVLESPRVRLPLMGVETEALMAAAEQVLPLMKGNLAAT